MLPSPEEGEVFCVHKWRKWLAPFLLAIQAALLVWIGTIKAPVYDEIAHVPAGLSHWLTGNYSLYCVNPPLVRMVSTIPLLATQPNVDWSNYTEAHYERPEFVIGRRFMDVNGPEGFWYYVACRWMLIPLVLLGGWICYLWASELYGRYSGLAALALWCFSPNILGWGAVNTPDVAAASLGVTAAYAFRRWMNSPGWATCFAAGITMGVVELTKTTWILLFVLWPILWLTCRYCYRRPYTSSEPTIKQMAVILVIAVYVLNLGYGFDGTLSRLDSFNFISKSLGGPEAHNVPGNRFKGTLAGLIPVPFPKHYLKGIDIQKYDFEIGKWSYLRGEHRRGGWWYWYIYALLVKEPIGTILLFALATIRAAFHERSNYREELLLLAPALAILLLVSSQTGFNRYIRYVLPVLPFLLIFASSLLKARPSPKIPIQYVGAFLVSIAIFEGMLSYPHSSSFFNAAVGGPAGGPSHLLDANIDWGQDLLLLRSFLQRRTDIKDVRLAYFGFARPDWAGLSLPSAPKSRELKGPLPPAGWYAISVNHVYGYRHTDYDKDDYGYFRGLKPSYRIGYSILIYEIK